MMPSGRHIGLGPQPVHLGLLQQDFQKAQQNASPDVAGSNLDVKLQLSFSCRIYT